MGDASRSVTAGAVARWALRAALGAAFLLVGLSKLTGQPGAVAYFSAIGWGQWFRYLTGTVDAAGGALLLVPAFTFRASAALFCVVGTASALALTRLRGDPVWGSPANVLAPLVLTGLILALGWMTRPARRRIA